MSKTKETIQIETALANETKEKRIYGCQEVTIGFYKQGLGNELVDFMTMDSNDVFRCYEIKVTLNDLRSNAKLSFYGHYNYLVVGENLYKQKDKWNIKLSNDIGIIVAKKYQKYQYCYSVSQEPILINTVSFEIVKKPKKRNLSQKEISLLKSSLIRSMYWKMEKYKDAGNFEEFAKLKSEANKNIKSFKEINKKYKNLERKHYNLISFLHRHKHFSEKELEDFF